jgi:hypothetical protein
MAQRKCLSHVQFVADIARRETIADPVGPEFMAPPASSVAE